MPTEHEIKVIITANSAQFKKAFGELDSITTKATKNMQSNLKATSSSLSGVSGTMSNDFELIASGMLNVNSISNLPRGNLTGFFAHLLTNAGVANVAITGFGAALTAMAAPLIGLLAGLLVPITAIAIQWNIAKKALEEYGAAAKEMEPLRAKQMASSFQGLSDEELQRQIGKKEGIKNKYEGFKPKNLEELGMKKSPITKANMEMNQQDLDLLRAEKERREIERKKPKKRTGPTEAEMVSTSRANYYAQWDKAEQDAIARDEKYAAERIASEKDYLQTVEDLKQREYETGVSTQNLQEAAFAKYQNKLTDIAKSEEKERADAAERLAGKELQAYKAKFDAMKDYAKQYIDAARERTNAVISEINRERNAAKQAENEKLEAAKARYSALTSMGNKAAYAQTGISLFGNKKKGDDKSPFTQAEILRANMRVATNNAREQLGKNTVDSALYGSSLNKAKELLNIPQMDTLNKTNTEQLGQIKTLVWLQQQQIDMMRSSLMQVRR